MVGNEPSRQDRLSWDMLGHPFEGWRILIKLTRNQTMPFFKVLVLLSVTLGWIDPWTFCSWFFFFSGTPCQAPSSKFSRTWGTMKHGICWSQWWHSTWRKSNGFIVHPMESENESQFSGSAFFLDVQKGCHSVNVQGIGGRKPHPLTDQPQKPQIQLWSIASFTRDLCFSYFSIVTGQATYVVQMLLVRTNQPIEQGSPCEYHWWLYKDPWQRVLLAYHESTEQLRRGRHFRKWWNTLIQKVNISEVRCRFGVSIDLKLEWYLNENWIDRRVLNDWNSRCLVLSSYQMVENWSVKEDVFSIKLLCHCTLPHIFHGCKDVPNSEMMVSQRLS